MARTTFQIEDINNLVELFGSNNDNIKEIEKKLNIEIIQRGNVLSLIGEQDNIDIACQIFRNLQRKLQKQKFLLTDIDIDLEIKSAGEFDYTDITEDTEFSIKTPKKIIIPSSKKQGDYIKELFKKDIMFASGVAGTGKTYLAVAVGVAMYLAGKVEKIVLSRPVVEAGEKLGYLPGDMKDKIDPYMQPLYDALYDMLPRERILKNIENRIFEIAPLAFMRGRTLKNSFVILDEAQNATKVQMKMFLTRLGKNSRMVITGDLSQIDLPDKNMSGLYDAIKKLTHIKDIGFIEFSSQDVVRHNLVAQIIDAYDAG